MQFWVCMEGMLCPSGQRDGSEIDWVHPAHVWVLSKLPHCFFGWFVVFWVMWSSLVFCMMPLRAAWGVSSFRFVLFFLLCFCSPVHVQVVKEINWKLIGFVPRRFESCRSWTILLDQILLDAFLNHMGWLFFLLSQCGCELKMSTQPNHQVVALTHWCQFDDHCNPAAHWSDRTLKDEASNCDENEQFSHNASFSFVCACIEVSNMKKNNWQPHNAGKTTFWFHESMSDYPKTAWSVRNQELAILWQFFVCCHGQASIICS